ncbi:MAG TPA: 3-hydroxyacyl-CoA dehydrogenase, partial [Planctomycetota bacterium]|nr:3-hydroxyacyl-CoA dehydrogenase [Planctomycetota bacterium]
MQQRDGTSPAGRLFVLDLSGNRIFSLGTDGSASKTIVSGCRLPDGIAVDVDAGHIYWTNMGVPSRNDGSIERVDLDGRNRTTIVPEGTTHTPKQLVIDRKNRRLYWADREGMRVMRARLDGSALETLVQTGQNEADRRDQTNWCVGIAVDPERGHVYWTQKGTDNGNVGRIFRAGIDIPKGQTAADRKDIEVLYEGLPEPIDLEIDFANR